MVGRQNKKDPLSNLLEILLARKVLFTIGFLSVFIIVLFGVKSLPSIYEAYTSIHISAPSLPEVKIPYINEIASRSYLQNQIRLLKSRIILEKIAKELKLDKVKEKNYDTLTKIKGKIKSLLDIKNEDLDPLEEAISYLRHSIYVHSPRGSSIVYIQATSKTPQSAATIANALAETYIDYSKNFFASKTKSSYHFIEKQVEIARQRLLESELALNEFKKKEKIFSINEERTIILQKMAELNEKHQEISLQIDNRERLVKNLIKSSKEVSIHTPINPEIITINNSETLRLNDKLKKLENELETTLGTLKENHPDVKLLRKRIDHTKIKLEGAKSKINVDIPFRNDDIEKKSPTRIEGIKRDIEGIKRDIEELKFRRYHLSNLLGKYKNRIEKLTNIQYEYEKLMQSFESEQESLKTLNNQFEAARNLKANDTNQSSIRIIDKAYPPIRSIKRKKLIFILIGFVAAMLFGISIAFIAEYIDETLKTAGEAEEYLGLPVLGTIPKSNWKYRKTFN